MPTHILEPRSAPGGGVCSIVTDPEVLASDYVSFGTDESKLAAGRVLSVAVPSSSMELAAVLAWHHARRHVVAVSGGRTGVVGGAVAVPSGHVVSTSRLRGHSAVALDERGVAHVRVLAGTPLVSLNEHLAEDWPDVFFPVDPTESSATLGGMVSTNASGTRSYRYGCTRAWVRALEVVLVDGRVLRLRRGEVHAAGGVLWLGSASGRRRLEGDPIRKPRTKHTIGYSYGPAVDAMDLFIGAEGTLGVVSEVELALAPRPQARLFQLQFLPDDDAAFRLVDGLRRAKELAVAAIEYFDAASLRLLAERVPPSRCRFVGLIEPSFRAAIYSEIELASADALETVVGQLSALVSAAGGSPESSVASSEPADWRVMKAFRHALPEQINALIAARKSDIPGLHKVSTDMAVEASDLRAIHAFYHGVLSRHGLEHYIFGHAGDNHLHVNIVPRTADELRLALQLYREFAIEVAKRGGAVAAEHGIGRLKKRFMRFQYSARELQTMRRIKAFFDPLGLLNPGVLLDAEPES